MLPYWLELAGDWQSVQDELIVYAARGGWTTEKNKTLFTLDTTIRTFKQSLPRLTEWLGDRGWRALELYWIVFNPEDPRDPHIDALGDRARINFPVMNCELTCTRFFRMIPEQLYAIKTRNQGLGYWGIREPLEEMTRVTLSRPTILNVGQPHTIDMMGQRLTRVTASVEVYPSCIHLLKQAQKPEE